MFLIPDSMILELDTVEVQEELTNLKPLSEYKHYMEVPQAKIEEGLKKICNKNNITVNFFADTQSSDIGILWHSEVLDCKNGAHLKDVYGLSLYEVLSKSLLIVCNIVRGRKKNKK